MPWQNYLTIRNLFDFTDIPSVGEQSRNQSPLWNLRQRLFLVLFERITTTYSSIVPTDCRKLVENIFLAFAIIPLFILIYIHVSFIQTPVNCLLHVSKDWPHDGILRIELNFKDQSLDINSYGTCSRNMPANAGSQSDTTEKDIMSSVNQSYFFHDLREKDMSKFLFNHKDITKNTTMDTENLESLFDHSKESDNLNMDIEMFSQTVWPQQQYIIEYSLEYGFLKLSPATRQKLKIPILIVVLDPNDEKCFGNIFSRFMLKYVVGYSDVLMSSLKNMVDKDENKGFVRNVVTGDQYRFVNKSLTWTSYVVAALTMVAFTLSISMLLRYSHHQIFLFIVQLLHVLEFNLNTSFPAASLLTVVFALVGMEAIMSEFFNDSTTAFYIILIVWIADQYDTICCHHTVTKRHWLRFFYLYHFAFYAYDYRFNGQYSSLALFTSWMFIQHSMIYFFHHFELPFEPRHLDEMPDLIDGTQIHNTPSLLSLESREIASFRHSSSVTLSSLSAYTPETLPRPSLEALLNSDQ